MTKDEVFVWLAKERLVPVIRAASTDAALRVVEALVEGGVKTLEVTMTVPGAIDVIQTLATRFGGQVLVGAGTVLDAATASACADSGAQFVVSPAFDPNVVAACNAMEVLVAPGALTPTEVVTAWRSGADIIKVFPCDALGGAAYIKSLKAPLPDIPLMPTGGVNLDTVADFFKAGAIAVGVGSSLVDAKLSHEELVKKARAFVERAGPCSG